MKAHRRLTLLTVFLPAVVGLGACSKDADKEKIPASQIAAKVNSGEISVHQVNYLLARANPAGASQEAAPKLRREALDRLIDQELAVEKAVEKKLDRSPEVLMALENARRDILARAYIEQVTAGVSKPTVDEAKKYYFEHPQLFAERRIYNIQEIVLPVKAGIADELRGMLDSAKTMDDIGNWLKGNGIKFAAGSATRSAEQIPLELLPKIHALKVGQGLVLQGPQSITVMRVAAAQTVPVPEEAALPRIQQFLGNQRAAEAAKEELKDLKGKAKITFMGEFAGTTASASSQPSAASASADRATENTAGNPKASANTAIEKGIVGLK